MAGSKGSKYYNVFLRYQLNLEDNDDNKILNCEGFELLLTIDRLRSIVAAAKAMDISYRKAWGIINKVETELGFPLVIKQRGGSDGGFTTLSTEGYELLEGYKELITHFDKSISNITKKFFHKINK
ncbi:MAG: LysR family transcriptional regulator [Bacteroidales bacterium]|nr:LysR family transcriptional regulator [Bacteroidales bacterium]